MRTYVEGRIANRGGVGDWKSSATEADLSALCCKHSLPFTGSFPKDT